ncbi:hypothetical protein [Arthrobacter sunyaminii]|uniref:hypothetical protein n=1 Tax=Arthrobacter sunyaminii TaxID=2816859 RepID=UPI001A950A02|nr:hypothetical protein [Arthrobacter sunyaminii]MBO0897395.1 hypothetical protein [Arthrobacter sunyaminii]
MKLSIKLAAAAAAVASLALSACTNDPDQTAEAPVTITVSASASTESMRPETTSPAPTIASPPPTQQRSNRSALEMTPEEAMHAANNGEITMSEYCARDTFFTSGDTQMCYFYKNPQPLWPQDYEEISWRDSPTRFTFTYDQAYAAWQQGTPYYVAFCLNYEPVTSGGISQCDGIQLGTVDGFTGEYIGP